jgi:hypothetical protein
MNWNRKSYGYWRKGEECDWEQKLDGILLSAVSSSLDPLLGLSFNIYILRIEVQGSP